MPNRILALDVSGSRLAAIVVEASFRNRTFLAHAVEPRDPERPLEQDVRAFLDRHRLAGDTVLAAIDGVDAGFRILDLPFRDRKKLAQTVPFEIETLVPVPLEDGIVDFQVLGPEAEGARLLAAIVPRTKVAERLETLAAAGVDPTVLGFAPLAAMNVARLLEDPPSGTWALLCGRGSEIVLGVWRDGDLVGLRVLGAAADDDAESVAAEVVWSLRSLRDGGGSPIADTIESLPVLFGGTFPGEIGEALRRRGLRPRALGECRARGLPEAIRARLGDLAVAIGLLEGRSGDEDALSIDFRREEFSHHGRGEELRDRLGQLGALAGAVLLLFGVSEAFSYYQLSSRYEALRGRVRGIFEETLPGTPVIDEISQIQEKIGELERRRNQLGGPVSVLEALREISIRSPENPRMFVDELSFDGPTILLRAKTSSFEAVETVKKNLAASELFRDVQVRDPRTTADGTVEFRLTIALGAGDAG